MVGVSDPLSEALLSERVQRIGSSGIRRVFDVAARRQSADLINLGLGEPDFDTPQFIKDAAQAAMDEGFNRYTPNAGALELRHVLAEKLERCTGVRYDPASEVIVTVGAMNAINLALTAVLNPGEEVLIPDPYFVGFEPCVLLAGGRPVAVPLREENAFRLDAHDLEAAITPRSKVVIVNSPQNPTGAVLTQGDLERIAEVCRRRRLLVLSDEVYEKLVFPESRHVSISSLPEMREQTVVVHSFSKAFCMCGWRIGYAAAPARIIEQMVKLQQFNSVHAPSYAQKGAMAGLAGPQDFLRDMVAEFDRRRQVLVGGLNAIPGISCTMPGGTFYAFANVRSLGLPSEEVSRILLEQASLVTVPGSVLGHFGEGYLRLSFTAPLDRLHQAVARFESVVARLGQGEKL